MYHIVLVWSQSLSNTYETGICIHLSMEFPVFNKGVQRKIYIYDLVKSVAARIISSFCTVTLKTGNWLKLDTYACFVDFRKAFDSIPRE